MDRLLDMDSSLSESDLLPGYAMNCSLLLHRYTVNDR